MANVTPTNTTWPNYSTSNVQKAAAKDNQSMGKDQFLKILITQLSNQDPTQPLQDKEFIAQMAQFTSVEQLMNISTQLTNMNQNLGNLSGLIGKQITWSETTKGVEYDSSTGQAVTNTSSLNGIVDSIVIRSGVQYAKVGDKEVALDKILQIDNSKPTTSAATNTTTGAGMP
ncbi:flagellar basal-body rod modification protein FlgD [Paenibacillus shirakamiensis]|uniref:Flagellar basal-body rod modification protein FlgD n=1 Tax=Paenibacillus shirakamiensis TaxID=1265935 RepID=A0ABS4JJ22_9BACL|nr:flagellar hook capping FlgD N-terminal domain-containing protein [Paenibacillus shirakamiensis]MBP2001115.1 flagellar basal-body rod modification protein FlgD [Paenibacillus shirakamiensis]